MADTEQPSTSHVSAEMTDPLIDDHSHRRLYFWLFCLSVVQIKLDVRISLETSHITPLIVFTE